MKITLPRFRRHTGRNRILSLDTLRGIAIVLMIMAHSYLNVDVKTIPRLPALSFWFLNYLPAIAFVWVAGVVFSYFLYSRPDPATVYRRYAARAGFLLLVAHPVINVASLGFTVPINEAPSGFSAFLIQSVVAFPITDTIAFCLLLSPFFIVHTTPAVRGAVIAVMLLITPFAIALLNAHTPSLILIKEALFGTIGEPRVFWWPLIPWLAIFLTGSFAGHSVASVRQGRLSHLRLANTMNKTGGTLALCGVLLTLGYKALKAACSNELDPALFAAIYPKQTTTLLPVYLGMLYFIVASLLHRIEIAGRYDRFLWFLSVFGRTSLFTFVVQFAVAESIPALLGWRGILGLTGFLTLFFMGTAAIWVFSFYYGRFRGWISDNDYGECLEIAKSTAMTPQGMMKHEN